MRPERWTLNRFMESPDDVAIAHWDHEPAVCSPGFSQSQPPPKGGTTNEGRFMERLTEMNSRIGTLNQKRESSAKRLEERALLRRFLSPPPISKRSRCIGRRTPR